MFRYQWHAVTNMHNKITFVYRQVEDSVFDGTKVRLYVPEHPDGRKAGILFVHGGGWLICSVGNTFYNKIYSLIYFQNQDPSTRCLIINIILYQISNLCASLQLNRYFHYHTETHDHIVSEISRRLNVMVVSVEYVYLQHQCNLVYLSTSAFLFVCVSVVLIIVFLFIVIVCVQKTHIRHLCKILLKRYFTSFTMQTSTM